MPEDEIVIERARRLLHAGGLVAFPTETVYGLGADARNAAAVAKIFAAKGRPSTNPLICHVANVDVARRFVTHWPDAARRVADAFWPGPLTIVLPAAASIVPGVLAGLPTVGVRVPDHPLALQLLRTFDGPLAGPSANRSNHISPTTADHVRVDLGNSVDLILDGGPCRVGIESTVLDLSGTTPAILRPGGISRSQIEALIGPVECNLAMLEETTTAVSPGQQIRHYAPVAKAVRLQKPVEKAGRVILRWPSDVPAECAAMFYAEMRKLDQQGPLEIGILLPPDQPEWSALRDRIIRATESEDEGVATINTTDHE